MPRDAFRQWESIITIGGKSLSLRASVQPEPYPPAVCLIHDRMKEAFIVPLADWPTIVTVVEHLKMEAELSGGDEA